MCSSSRCDHTAAYHFPLGTIWVASLLCLMVNGAAMNPTPLCKSLSESPWGRTRVPGDADPQRAQVPSHKHRRPAPPAAFMETGSAVLHVWWSGGIGDPRGSYTSSCVPMEQKPGFCVSRLDFHCLSGGLTACPDRLLFPRLWILLAGALPSRVQLCPQLSCFDIRVACLKWVTEWVL